VVNFINVLRAAFKRENPNSAKKYSQAIFLGFLGSGWVKASHKMLVKLTPDHQGLQVAKLEVIQ